MVPIKMQRLKSALQKERKIDCIQYVNIMVLILHKY